MVAPRKEQFKKIAICILAHTDFDNLERLIVALDSDYFDIYIHIDAKCGEINSTQFSSLARHSSVMVINERVSVHWGDYSVVRAMLLLYRKVLESDSSYAKIALISGLDYPILSNQDIYSKLSGSKELICGSKLDNRSAKFRVMTYHAMSAPRAIRYVARTFSKYLHIYKQNFVVVDGAKLPIWFACQWTALTPNFVEYLLDCMDRNPSIRKYFSTSYAPDELLIPTLLFNSSFKNRAAGTLNDGGGATSLQ